MNRFRSLRRNGWLMVVAGFVVVALGLAYRPLANDGAGAGVLLVGLLLLVLAARAFWLAGRLEASGRS